MRPHHPPAQGHGFRLQSAGRRCLLPHRISRISERTETTESTGVGHSVNSESFDFNNSSVLLVDDEPGMRTALRANFLRHGWQVETADGVRAAASAMERREFDLIVTDVRMRDGDGFEVMSLVRKDSPRTAVIL